MAITPSTKPLDGLDDGEEARTWQLLSSSESQFAHLKEEGWKQMDEKIIQRVEAGKEQKRDATQDEKQFSGMEEMYPGYFQGKLDRLEPCFDGDYFYSCCLSHAELGLPAVIVQGDLWTNNILFPSNDGCDDRLVAILDWQGTHAGNLAEDISRLLVTSVHSDLRRQHTETILRHYYDQLCSLLGKAPFEFGDVLKAYERILHCASLDPSKRHCFSIKYSALAVVASSIFFGRCTLFEQGTMGVLCVIFHPCILRIDQQFESKGREENYRQKNEISKA